MTVEEVFKSIAERQLQGLMMHEDLANYYDFLNLHGYKKCQEYHFQQEICAYRKLESYYINHCGKILHAAPAKIDVIPQSIYSATREQVDPQSKAAAVKQSLSFWVKWQKRSRQVYTKAYQDLMSLGDAAAAFFIKQYICDVDEEIKNAERHLIHLKSVAFDLTVINQDQKELHKKYKSKLKEKI